MLIRGSSGPRDTGAFIVGEPPVEVKYFEVEVLKAMLE
jgi:hypothetical protein